MSVLLEFVVGLLMLVLRTVLEKPIIWIGEIALWAVTLGRHTPRWDSYIAEGGGDYAFLSEASFWIGLAAICGIGTITKWLFF